MNRKVVIYLTSAKTLVMDMPEESARKLANLVGDDGGQAIVDGHVIDVRAIDAIRISPGLPEWPT